MEFAPEYTFTSKGVRKHRWTMPLHNPVHYLRHRYRAVLLLALPALLIFSGLLAYFFQSHTGIADAAASRDCTWYRIRAGDTLGRIASLHHTTVLALAQTNNLSNINLIIAGKSLCLSQAKGAGYNHSNLQFASQGQVASQLRQAARKYNLPLSLLYAIAWEESGWNQRAISPDGGIGVMQLMPYTAAGLSIMAGSYHDPYILRDNINLGALYLHTLWVNFHGNLPKVISAYNEGGWNVAHRGIFNWRYVNNVLALMHTFS